MIYFFTDSHYIHQRVNLNDIIHLKAARSYCDIHLKNGTRFTTSISMGKVLEIIEYDDLFRISRFETINLKYVKSLRGNMVRLTSGTEHQVTSSYKELFGQKIKVVKQ